MSVFESADVEVKVRRLLREAVEAMFPTRMFYIDTIETDAEFPSSEGFVGQRYEWPKKSNHILVLQFLPAIVIGLTATDAMVSGLQWLSHRVRMHGPPRLASEAERWTNELESLGVPAKSDEMLAEWSRRCPSPAWIDLDEPEPDTERPRPGKAASPKDSDLTEPMDWFRETRR